MWCVDLLGCVVNYYYWWYIDQLLFVRCYCWFIVTSTLCVIVPHSNDVCDIDSVLLLHCSYSPIIWLWWCWWMIIIGNDDIVGVLIIHLGPSHYTTLVLYHTHILLHCPFYGQFYQLDTYSINYSPDACCYYTYPHYDIVRTMKRFLFILLWWTFPVLRFMVLL